MIAFTTYATGDYIPGQELLAKTALAAGADRVSKWRREDLVQTDFYRRHQDILDRPRGAGYWLWKPYFILQDLLSLNEGDFLIYYDCGHPEKPYRVKRPLHLLTEWCHEAHGGMLPGLYLPKYGANQRWTKGETFQAMGCDAPIFREHPQVQAGLSVWEKHQASIDFLEEWLHWCSQPQALLDDQLDPAIPNAPNFVEHRRDQSVLTLVVLKRGVKCLGSPLVMHKGERRINCLIDRVTGGPTEMESYAHLFPSLAGTFPDPVAA